MTDVVDTKQEVPEIPEVVQAPSIEDRARTQGWKPKEEFDGDVSKWVSAETFVAKGELIDKIEYLGKKLKDSERAIDMLKQHHGQVKEAEFKRAVQFLQAQKKEAFKEGNADLIIAIDDKIEEVREAAREAKQQATVQDTLEEDPGDHPSFVSWVSENDWYNKNPEMRKDADALGLDYASAHPRLAPEKVLKYVSQEMKKLYPEHFSNPLRSKPSGVEGTSHRPTKGSSFELDDNERRIMNTFINQGIMTKEEYINELKRVKGIE